MTDASPVRQVRRRLHRPPDPRRQPRHQHTTPGLSVPDWPTSYGWNMFTFPPSMWVGGIFYEHGHRLIASTVGFLTIILAAWLWLRGPAPLAALVRRRRARRRSSRRGCSAG